MAEDLPGRLKDWFSSYHAEHDCDPGKCACKCGCDVEMGCRVLGPLCSVCSVRYMRDDEEHGPKEDDSTA